MRKAWWASACILAGACVGLGFYAAFRRLVYRSLPRVSEMRAACGVGGTHTRGPTTLTAADCSAYFTDLGVFHHAAITGSLLTALIAAYVFLVWRFRVRPLQPRANGLRRRPE